MQNLSKIVINPDTEVMIMSVEEYNKLQTLENESLKEKLKGQIETNKVQQYLLKGYYADLHKLKLENRELRKRLEDD